MKRNENTGERRNCAEWNTLVWIYTTAVVFQPHLNPYSLRQSGVCGKATKSTSSIGQREKLWDGWFYLCSLQFRQTSRTNFSCHKSSHFFMVTCSVISEMAAVMCKLTADVWYELSNWWRFRLSGYSLCLRTMNVSTRFYFLFYFLISVWTWAMTLLTIRLINSQLPWSRLHSSDC